MIKHSGKTAGFTKTIQTRAFLLFFFLSSSFADRTLAAEPIQMEAPGIDGQLVRLSDYRGKWVLVNFWATWCPPCLEEIPELVIFHETHQDDIAVVIGINYEKVSDSKVKHFMETYSISYPVAKLDPSTKTPFGHISGLPTSFLIDPQGRLAARQVGPVTSALIEEFIAANGGNRK